METTYKVGDLRKLVSESSSEFKAKLGSGVESEDKKNNGKAYSDAKQRAKSFDGGLADEIGKNKAEYKKEDGNKTTLHYDINGATPEYRNRVKANVKGYSSEKEMKNGIEKSGEFDNNENIYNAFKKESEDLRDKEVANRKSGLKSSKQPEDMFDREGMFESVDGFNMRAMIEGLKSITENNEKPDTSHVKTVFFKKTEFLNETHMKSRIPDDFKTNGTTFKMKDKTGNEYLLEWRNNKAVVLEHTNKNGADEALDRMKNLFDYKTSDTQTSRSSRLNENDDVYAETLNKMRRIIK